MAASVAILLSALLMAVGAFGRYPLPAAFTVTSANCSQEKEGAITSENRDWENCAE